MKTRSPAEVPLLRAALADEFEIALILTSGDDLRALVFGFALENLFDWHRFDRG